MIQEKLENFDDFENGLLNAKKVWNLIPWLLRPMLTHSCDNFKIVQYLQLSRGVFEQT